MVNSKKKKDKMEFEKKEREREEKKIMITDYNEKKVFLNMNNILLEKNLFIQKEIFLSPRHPDVIIELVVTIILILKKSGFIKINILSKDY